MPLERLGNEKISVESGAATKVSSKDPTKSPGKLPNPNDMAPSSRKGRTTKYALKICKSENVECKSFKIKTQTHKDAYKGVS